ncbi:MAG: CDP-diacylglycerol--serine O-phosphatidyltransferase [Sulfurimonadaceae bacterium]|jgi:CDP-diacylglycerol--serine O-phosphatidyltransferase|nr:CDP-diacylglycerol--serine O-phosphatidyltransferase [Sulfurimonadaceae bacterium]
MKSPANLAYILPNLFTAASIFSGMLSMMSAINGDFSKAAWLIFLSLLFDGLDGRVARLTNTSSKFGMEFDSLADIVAFGVAPALLVFLYAGEDYGRLGVVASALFVIFGAIRLARFNLMTTEPTVFIGVPIPAAAIFVTIIVLLFDKYNLKEGYGVLLLVATIVASILMVTNIRYPSFKKVDTNKKHIRKIFASILFLLLLIFIYPIEGLATLFICYILYGPIRAIFVSLTRLRKT